MISDSEIIFVTTTLYTKWLVKQQSIIKREFPNSKTLLVNGRGQWPNVWFSWIPKLKEYQDIKWVIHIDEDFFITNKDELIKVIQNMSDNDIDACGIPDGNHMYRGANPIAFNAFLMIMSYQKLIDLEPKLNLNNLRFGYDKNRGCTNSFGVFFNREHLTKFDYKFEITGGHNYEVEQEPYYYFIWMMLENGFKFDYLYPYFDDTYKSTNPRISKDSPNIGIHMWYVRDWTSRGDVHGLPNVERYNLLEKFLN